MGAPAHRDWAISCTGLPNVWRGGVDGRGVTIGVLDRGLDPRHPALSGRVQCSLVVDREGRAVRLAGSSDGSLHGAATASIAVGAEVDGLLTGVAPGAHVAAAACLESGAVLARIALGLEALVAAGARVICMPFGLREPSPLLCHVLRHLRSNGVVTIAAAGNGGTGSLRAPADFDQVISVGAADRSGQIASMSGSRVNANGTCAGPTVVAPGVDVCAAGHPRATTIVTGTSYAAAHVAGVAALLLQAAPQAGPGDVEWAIETSCRPLPDDQRHRSRFGHIDAAAAIDRIVRHRAPHRASVGPAPARFVDPLLGRELARLGPDAPVSALVTGLLPKSGALAVIPLPLIDAAIIRGPACVVRAFTEDPSVCIASSTRIDRSAALLSPDRLFTR